MDIARRVEGVEEKKEDTQEDSAEHCTRSKSEENDEEERNHGFQAQLEKFARIVFGSCGTAMEAATVFVRGEHCDPNWRDRQAKQDVHPGPPAPPPLSIADELRRLAAQEGKVFGGPRAEDIPRFLGEEAVNSFEDDNISAISQHTLEEIASQRRKIQQHHKEFLRQQQQPRIIEKKSLEEKGEKGDTDFEGSKFRY